MGLWDIRVQLNLNSLNSLEHRRVETGLRFLQCLLDGAVQSPEILELFKFCVGERRFQGSDLFFLDFHQLW